MNVLPSLATTSRVLPDMTSLPLEITQRELSWPSREDVLRPKGAGPRVLAELANLKIGGGLSRTVGEGVANVGVLLANPDANETSAPLAVVCEFLQPVTESTLREAHRLAWNFSRAAVLLTVEPHLIRAWTCCEIPSLPRNLDSIEEKAPNAVLETLRVRDLGSHLNESFHWVNLISGGFASKYPERFRPEQRADRSLLENLRSVRAQLHAQNLPLAVIHDLLARIIFIQFLSDRKDSNGRAALDQERLLGLHEQGLLAHAHDSLGSVLRSYDDTYALFGSLDKRFNGDLFSSGSDGSHSGTWAAEQELVKPSHLSLLADFVDGRLELRNGQHSLWRLYSFDAIPLDFISSVYEEFVAKTPGVVYTPSFLVDFVLDSVLPWNSTAWDVRVLDPACGSGIFLVKAYQRLIHRWKLDNPESRLDARQLRRILERNLFGVDKDEDAIRVAAFSLYLAMCDEIDPKHYWNQVTFPKLRGERLIVADFFREDQPGFSSSLDCGAYDCVVGNVPWARGSLRDSHYARQWGATNGWAPFEENIGPVFLPKAAALTREGGHVALLQPAVLIFADFATEFRRQLFTTYEIEDIVNLSALRHQLFSRAVGPACIVTLRNKVPSTSPTLYISPKPTHLHEDQYRIAIEPQDISFVQKSEAANDPTVWAALVWGGRRDLALVRRLASTGRTLNALRGRNLAVARNGIVWGSGKRKVVPTLLGRAELKGSTFPTSDGIHLDTRKLPLVSDAQIHHKDQVDLRAFTAPQLIVKRSWSAKSQRFEATLVSKDDPTGGVVCSQNFVSVHVAPEYSGHLEAAWMSYNSHLAVYYLFLTSGRTASYRPNLRVTELLGLPYPEPRPGMLDSVKSSQGADEVIRQTFDLHDLDWALIDDLTKYTIPDFKLGARSPGRQSTRAGGSDNGTEGCLNQYCEYMMRVLRRSFSRPASATIFRDENGRLPLRLVAIHLGGREDGVVAVHTVRSQELLNQFGRLADLMSASPNGHGARLQRITRVYTTQLQEGEAIPTVFMVKPDQVRYWTRSAALHDADEMVADAAFWKPQHVHRESPPVSKA